MSIKWLLVSAQHHPSQGGIGTYVSRFASAAVEAGWHLELMTGPSDVLPRVAAVHTVQTADMAPDFAQRMPRLRELHMIRPYRYALWSVAVARKLQELNGPYDAIEFVDCQAEGHASLNCSAIRDQFLGARMLIHAHTPMFVEERINGADPKRFGRNFYNQWERDALSHADGLMATSRGLLEQLPRVAQSAILPYPIRDEVRAAMSSPTAQLIVVVASVQPRKGIECWMRSLKSVLRACPLAQAVLIGPDTLADDGVSFIKRFANALDDQVRDRLLWLGALPHSQTLDWIARASLVVVPSLFDSFSFAAAEALLCGTPVIVSDQVGIAEHVRALRTFPAGDDSALSELQLRMLRDRAAAVENMGRCRSQLLEACAPQRHLRTRINLLESIQAAASTRSNFAGDSLDELERFIEEVEHAESGAASLSSEVW